MFTYELKSFLTELKSNNNKDWFHANKSVYEKVMKNPSREFVEFMRIRFSSLGLPYIADVKKSLFRVNRDIRFSNNKEPYKTNLGIYFPYTQSQTLAKASYTVGIYMHIDTDQCFIGGGIHMPEPPALKAIRTRISEEWQDLEKIFAKPQFKKEFSSILEGESLKTMPRGYSADHPKADWLKLKEFLAMCYVPEIDIYSDRIAQILEKKAVAIAPFLEYLLEAIEYTE